MWNECFTFDITHGKEPLKVTVYDRDTFGKDEFEGMFYVPLEPEEMINLRD